MSCGIFWNHTLTVAYGKFSPDHTLIFSSYRQVSLSEVQSFVLPLLSRSSRGFDYCLILAVYYLKWKQAKTSRILPHHTAHSFPPAVLFLPSTILLMLFYLHLFFLWWIPAEATKFHSNIIYFRKPVLPTPPYLTGESVFYLCSINIFIILFTYLWFYHPVFTLSSSLQYKSTEAQGHVLFIFGSQTPDQCLTCKRWPVNANKRLDE